MSQSEPKLVLPNGFSEAIAWEAEAKGVLTIPAAAPSSSPTRSVRR